MSAADRKAFTDEVLKCSRSNSNDFGNAIAAFCRMAMFDMLPAFAALSPSQKFSFFEHCVSNSGRIGEASMNRIRFARWVVLFAEIRDFNLPLEQVNDGREFLGCTRLDDAGVQEYIDKAFAAAKVQIANGGKGTTFARSGTPAAACCGEIGVAWTEILVGWRRAQPGASLIANLAAAAHYMLARYHTCMGKAAKWQMNWVVDGYDANKRVAIKGGDKELKSMALTANRPFPPDYAIAAWAYKGSADGANDCARCNKAADVPWLVPEVNNKEWGFE